VFCVKGIIVTFRLHLLHVLVNCHCDSRDDEEEDMEETIQKRRGRRKKKKTGKIGKKEKEPLEEVKPSEEEYEQTG